MVQVKDWSQDQIDAVWEAAEKVPHTNPDVWRKDCAGAWIKRSGYGDNTTKLGYGWQIDHRKPISRGGADDIENLQPLQWENNEAKSDSYPTWTSTVSSESDRNVYRKHWHSEGPFVL